MSAPGDADDDDLFGAFNAKKTRREVEEGTRAPASQVSRSVCSELPRMIRRPAAGAGRGVTHHPPQSPLRGDAEGIIPSHRGDAEGIIPYASGACRFPSTGPSSSMVGSASIQRQRNSTGAVCATAVKSTAGHGSSLSLWCSIERTCRPWTTDHPIRRRLMR